MELDKETIMFLKDNKSKLLGRAQKYIQKGYLDKAINEYRKVIDVDPNDLNFRLRVGDLYIKTGRNEEASKEYTEVARIYTKKGFYLKAIAVYKQVLKINPKDVDIRYKLADLYVKQHLIADAIAEYTVLAENFEAKNRHEEVLTLVKKMVEIAPDNVLVRLRLAEIYQNVGYTADAMSEYEICVNALTKKKNFTEAEEIYHRVYQGNQNEPKIIDMLINIYKEKGDKEKYLRYSKELASFYGVSGDDEKMKAIYERILEVYPNDEYAMGALRRASMSIEESLVEEGVEIGEEGDIISWPDSEAQAVEIIDAIGNVIEDIVVEADNGESIIPWSESEVEKEPECLESELDIIDLDDVLEEIQVEAESMEESPIISNTTIEEELPVTQEEDYIDLSTDIEIEEAIDTLAGSWDSGTTKGSFDGFKGEIVEQHVGEDAETHFNHAIAYMEMDMYDEAIKEFNISCKESGLEFNSFVRLGLCNMSKGRPEEAVACYLMGLKVKGVSDDERKGLLYELALACDAAEQREESIKYFATVYEMDNHFRDVSEKMLEHNKHYLDRTIPMDDDLIEIELM